MAQPRPAISHVRPPPGPAIRLNNSVFFLGKQVSPTVKLEGGFSFVGEVDLFGAEVYCKVVLNSEEFLLEIKMNALKLNLITFSKLDGKEDEGPELIANIHRKEHTAGVSINAKVTVLGISVGAKIAVSNAGYNFVVEGKIFNMFSARLTCQADYADIKKTFFKVGKQKQSHGAKEAKGAPQLLWYS